jgi:hypothetical protein
MSSASAAFLPEMPFNKVVNGAFNSWAIESNVNRLVLLLPVSIRDSETVSIPTASARAACVTFRDLRRAEMFLPMRVAKSVDILVDAICK